MRDHITSSSFSSRNLVFENYSSNIIKRGLSLANRIIDEHSSNIDIELIDLSEQEIAQNYFQQGIVYHKSGSYQEAINDFSLALSIDPNFIEIYILRFFSYIHLMKFSLALNDYRKAYEIDPIMAENFFEEVNSVILNLNEGNTKDIYQIVLFVGNYYYEVGSYERAIQVYTTILKFNPNDCNIYNKRSSAHSAMKNYQEAFEDLQKASETVIAESKLFDSEDYLQLLEILFSILDEFSDTLPDFVEECYKGFQKGFQSL